MVSSRLLHNSFVCSLLLVVSSAERNLKKPKLEMETGAMSEEILLPHISSGEDVGRLHNYAFQYLEETLKDEQIYDLSEFDVSLYVADAMASLCENDVQCESEAFERSYLNFFPPSESAKSHGFLKPKGGSSNTVTWQDFDSTTSSKDIVWPDDFDIEIIDIMNAAESATSLIESSATGEEMFVILQGLNDELDHLDTEHETYRQIGKAVVSVCQESTKLWMSTSSDPSSSLHKMGTLPTNYRCVHGIHEDDTNGGNPKNDFRYLQANQKLSQAVRADVTGAMIGAAKFFSSSVMGPAAVTAAETGAGAVTQQQVLFSTLQQSIAQSAVAFTASEM